MLLYILSESEIPTMEIPVWVEIITLSILFLALMRLYYIEAVSRISAKLQRDKKSQKGFKKQNEKSIFSNEVFFSDLEDSSLQISKRNPDLRIRTIQSSNSKDFAEICFSVPHKFEGLMINDLVKSFPNLVSARIIDSHKIIIEKSAAVKWEKFGEGVLKYLFQKFVENV